MNECDPKRTIIEHANVFTVVNTRELEPGTQPYVLPSQREQVFYLEVPGKACWSDIVRYDPSERSVKYNAPEEEYNVEEEGDLDQEELVINVDVQCMCQMNNLIKMMIIQIMQQTITQSVMILMMNI